MADRSVDKSLERALGDLEGTVRALQDTFKTWMEHWSHQDQEATRGRKELYARVDALSNQLAASSATLDTVRSDMEEMKRHITENVMPTIEAYREDTAHRSGMWVAGKLFWGIVLAICTVVGFFIHESFQYFTKVYSALPPNLPKGH